MKTQDVPLEVLDAIITIDRCFQGTDVGNDASLQAQIDEMLDERLRRGDPT